MIKKIIQFGIGNAGTAGLNVIVTIYFSKNLGEADFSNFVMFQTIVNFLFCIVGYNLGAGVLKKTQDEKQLKEYVRAAIFLNISIAMLLIIIFEVMKGSNIKYFHNASFGWTNTILVTLLFVLFQLSFVILQSKGEASKYLILRNLYALAIFLSIAIIGDVYKKNWLSFYGVQAILMGVVFLIVGSQYISKLKINEYKNIKKELMYSINFGAKLMPYTLSGWIVGSLDKALLTNQHNKITEVAILAVGQSIFAVAAFIFIAINSAWAPKFFELKKTNEENKIKKYRKKYFLIIISVVAMVLMGGVIIEEFYLKRNNPSFFIVMLMLAIIKIIDGDAIFHSNYFYFYEDVSKLSKIAITSSVLYLGVVFAGGSEVGVFWLLAAGIFNSLWVNVSYRLYIRRKNEKH